MHIKRAKKEIKDSVEAYLQKDAFGDYKMPSVRQRPILLMGPPGIGKTQIMEQIARECGIALVSYTITHHTRQSAIGLPFIREKIYGGKAFSVTEYTMSEIIASVYDKMEQTGLKEGILFLDEINCVSETLAPAMLQFLQCKMFGNQKVPEGWIIVAAGNPPEYNKSVRDFDVVTLDRIRRIDVEEDYGVWREYAYQAGIHPAILSYLELRKEYFYRMETTVDGRMFATARGWEDLSVFLKACEDVGKRADREVVHQYIQHWKIAKDFANYLTLYEKYKKDYGLEAILHGQYSADILEKLKFASFDERLSVVGLLLGRLSEMFEKSYLSDQYVSRLFVRLKEYKAGGDLEKTAGEAAEEYEKLRRMERLTKKADHMLRRVNDTLDRYLQILKGAHPADREEAFELVRAEFQKEAEQREREVEAAGQALEHAFYFMEEAFGDSQEMASFVTELNTNYYSVQYLKENDCAMYDKYNKRLLVDEQREKILEEMEEAEAVLRE